MNDTQQKELSIDTPAGLAEFWHFIEDVYRDYIVAMQQTPGAEILVGGDLVAVETARQRARELIAHHTKVLEFGGDLYQEDIEELQRHYDTIASAYDALMTPTESEGEATLTGESSGIDATRDRAEALTTRADDLVYEFSELETVVPTTAELKLGKLLYGQLVTVANSAAAIVRKIEQSTHSISSPEEILSMAVLLDTELDTLTDTLLQLEKSLLRFFEADSFREQTPERKTRTTPEQTNSRVAKLFDQPSVFTDMLTTVLREPHLREMVQTHYATKAGFEAALSRAVSTMERPSKLDAFLGIKHTSAFSFLKDMTIREIDSFDTEQSREAIRAILESKNIPYETYLGWIQVLPYLESIVDTHEEMTFLELFIRSEIAFLASKNDQRRNTQGVYNIEA